MCKKVISLERVPGMCFPDFLRTFTTAHSTIYDQPKTPQIFTTPVPAQLPTCDTIIRSHAEAAKGDQSSRGGRWALDEAEGTEDARLLAWRGVKEANLRALFASLEAALCPGLGWKKVGMHEFVA